MLSKIMAILALLAGIGGIIIDSTNLMLYGVIIGLAAIVYAISEKKA